MKRKSILIGGVAFLALGIFALTSFYSATAVADEDETADTNETTVITVQTGTVERVTLYRYVTGYGMVEAEPATREQPAAGGALAAPTAGVVEKVDAVAGQKVKQGDVLVELNSATATFDYAKAEVERQKKLFAQQNTSLKNLEDAKAQLASLEVIAPVSGTVVSIAVKPGEAVDVNALVAEVIDLKRLAVATKIPAAQAIDLKTGQGVQVLSEPPVDATLSFISPAVDASDGTVSAWAALPADSGLRPGEFVQLKIVTEVLTNCLAVPAESVVTDEDGNSTVALVKGDEATQVPVQIGLRDGDWVEITSTNLNEHDTIVTVGAYGLPATTEIKIANSPPDETSATNSAQ
ncbi:MAG TPA: efflux RND transporter periplasmic adaptor subunit [Verrucomicrobiae bacterium]|nr:efflux RND transporter periplasmic adaptor subunit [Verrucomicrobiae bacterium]